MTPASIANRTRAGRPSSPTVRTVASRTPDAHAGYEAKSAITAMTTDLGTSITMAELVLSATLGAYLPDEAGSGSRSPRQRFFRPLYHRGSPHQASPLQDIRGAS